MNWTKILAEHNLETPGFEEAVRRTNESTKEKKRLAALGYGKKSKKKK